PRCRTLRAATLSEMPIARCKFSGTRSPNRLHERAATRTDASAASRLALPRMRRGMGRRKSQRRRDFVVEPGVHIFTRLKKAIRSRGFGIFLSKGMHLYVLH